jgi:hypothetical protein
MAGHLYIRVRNTRRMMDPRNILYPGKVFDLQLVRQPIRS